LREKGRNMRNQISRTMLNHKRRMNEKNTYIGEDSL
jgi:hypothetical protein